MPESFIIADGYSSAFLMNDNRDNLKNRNKEQKSKGGAIALAFEYWLPNKIGQKEKHKTETNSVVIIGANGSGKSKLGAWIEQQDLQNIHRIGGQSRYRVPLRVPLRCDYRCYIIIKSGEEGKVVDSLDIM